MEFKIIKPKIEIAQVMLNYELKSLDTTCTIRIGRYNEKNKYRILFKIPIYEVPEDAEITSAKVSINVIDKEAECSNILTPYALIDDWSKNTVTWCHQPWFNKDICGESVNIIKKSQYIIDITTILQKWHNNSIPNYGIVLKNSELSNKTFVTLSTDKNISCGPKVEICYKVKCPCISISTKFIE